jgi:hypothetical protein
MNGYTIGLVKVFHTPCALAGIATARQEGSLLILRLAFITLGIEAY